MKTNQGSQMRAILAAAVVSLLVVGGCGRRQESTQASARFGKPVVVCANYPLQYFAERIGGRLVQVKFLVPGDVDPAFWEPSPKDIIAMQQADRVLLNGAGYEKWLPQVTLSESRLVDTAAGLHDQLIREEGAVTHQHGPGGQHTHGGVAFTTWLDLSLAGKQAQAVHEALRRMLSDKAADLQARLNSLTNDLTGLDRDLQAWGQSLNGQPVIASHPVYQYFARRYGLNLKSVHWEPDVVPDETGWRELEALLREHPARIMIWEGEPARETVERLMRLEVHSVLFSPCSNVPKQGDFLGVMRSQGAALRQ